MPKLIKLGKRKMVLNRGRYKEERNVGSRSEGKGIPAKPVERRARRAKPSSDESSARRKGVFAKRQAQRAEMNVARKKRVTTRQQTRMESLKKPRQ